MRRGSGWPTRRDPSEGCSEGALAGRVGSCTQAKTLTIDSRWDWSTARPCLERAGPKAHSALEMGAARSRCRARRLTQDERLRLGDLVPRCSSVASPARMASQGPRQQASGHTHRGGA